MHLRPLGHLSSSPCPFTTTSGTGTCPREREPRGFGRCAYRAGGSVHCPRTQMRSPLQSVSLEQPAASALLSGSGAAVELGTGATIVAGKGGGAASDARVVSFTHSVCATPLSVALGLHSQQR